MLHVMSPAFRDENITSSLYLCNLFLIFSVVIISGYMCARVSLYTIVPCTYGNNYEYVSYWLLFVQYVMSLAFFCWYASLWILCNYGYIFVTVHTLIISSYPPSCSIVRWSFCATVLCFSNDTVTMIVNVTDPQLGLFVQAVQSANWFILFDDRM